MPRAGDLRERVLFQSRAPADDGYGNAADAWTSRFERAALFLMRPGSEAVTAARLERLQPVTMIVRFDSQTCTITPAWRAIDQRTGEIYAIQAAADMQRKRQWWTLVCLAGAAP